jgi:hypothetical protein
VPVVVAAVLVSAPAEEAVVVVVAVAVAEEEAEVAVAVWAPVLDPHQINNQDHHKLMRR